jgi:hypothetical protein
VLTRTRALSLVLALALPFAATAIAGCAESTPPPAQPAGGGGGLSEPAPPGGGEAGGQIGAPPPKLPDDPGELGQRCEKSDSAACAKLGGMFARGEGGIKQDDLKALLLLKKGCEGGVKEACDEVKRLESSGRGKYAPPKR